MKVITLNNVEESGRKIECPDGGFVSFRYLLKSDGMGYTVTRTLIPQGGPYIWHYKHHLEACYCVSGVAELIDMENHDKYMVYPGSLYALDKNEKHSFRALIDTELICVFNPPLSGNEVHDENRSYKLEDI